MTALVVALLHESARHGTETKISAYLVGGELRSRLSCCNFALACCVNERLLGLTILLGGFVILFWSLDEAKERLNMIAKADGITVEYFEILSQRMSRQTHWKTNVAKSARRLDSRRLIRGTTLL